MSITVQGADRLIKKLEKKASPEQIQAALGKACALVERSAKQKAPKGRTGELRRSITSMVVPDGNSYAGIIYTPLEYAPYVEYGTGIFAEGGNGRQDVPWAYEDEETGELIWTCGQHPHPYMRPAVDENREEILRILKEGLKDD